jgi:hypothetical protein
MRYWLILMTPLALGATAPAPVVAPISLGFAVKEGSVAKHPALERVDPDGPCGPVATLRVTAVPDFKPSEPFTTNPAVELNSSGKIVRRWRLPADYTVSALDGDWMLISYAGKSNPLWVNAEGKLGMATSEDADFALGGNDGVMVTEACPAGATIPQGAQCLSVRDRPAQMRRIIATAGVCS